MNVFITGIGVISAIGVNVKENFLSLKGEKTGIHKITPPLTDEEILVGAVSLDDQELKLLGQSNHEFTSRTSLLGTIAAREAWGKNRLDSSIRTGIISSTSVGGMDRSEIYYQQRLKNQQPNISLLITHDSGNTTEKIAHDLGISGYINTLSTACSSGANSIMLGARLILQNKLDRVLVGGTDSFTSFTNEGFKSLMIYDDQWVKPFDESRKGLNLGEGSGFLLLENEKSISKTGNETIALLSGWGNAADAYHQTASSPDGRGATLAIKEALSQANMNPQDISYINAHGTGTPNNDLSESVAIKNVFENNIPPFSSTKSYTGHTLAASGAIEAVFSILAIKNDVVFPNLNFSTPISETGLVPELKWSDKQSINVVLSNSFGFGGNNSSLVFKKV